MKLVHPIFLLVLTITGCKTLEDFNTYTAGERASRICSSSSVARQRRARISELEPLIEIQSNLLATGYRVHTQCKHVPMEGYRVATRKDCTETPVAIDPAYEKSVLNNLKQKLSATVSAHNMLTGNCLRKARSLGAEHAYAFYKARREP